MILFAKSYNNSVKRTRLFIIDTLNKILKRTMMAAGSHLNTNEILSAKKFVWFIAEKLRKGPLTQDDLIGLVHYSTINTKVFQHIVTSMFPNATFNLSLLAERYTSIKIRTGKEVLGWDDLIAVHNASIMRKSPFFANGLLQVLAAPEYDPKKPLVVIKNSQAYLNTGQPFPDYYYVCENNVWTRFYDLKAGAIKPMSGHIFICSNSVIFEDKCRDLLNAQRNSFNTMGAQYLDIVDFLEEVISNSKITWAMKNREVQLYYATKIKDLTNVTPSLIFHHDVFENFGKFYEKDQSVTTKSCFSMHTTYDVCCNALMSRGDNTMQNYLMSYGISQGIKKKLLMEAVQFLLQNVHEL